MAGVIIALLVLAAIVTASLLVVLVRRYLGLSRRSRTGGTRKRNPTSIRKN